MGLYFAKCSSLCGIWDCCPTGDVDLQGRKRCCFIFAEMGVRIHSKFSKEEEVGTVWESTTWWKNISAEIRPGLPSIWHGNRGSVFRERLEHLLSEWNGVLVVDDEGHTVEFEKEEDAVLFLLRWS